MRKLCVISFLAIFLGIFSSCSKETIVLTDPAIVNGFLPVQVGQNHQILYQVDPEGTPVTWTSNNTAVVTMFGDYIYASSVGQAEIVGTTPKGGNASFKVSVTGIPVTDFNIPKSLKIYIGQTVELPVTGIQPDEADARSISWSAASGFFSWTAEEDKLLIKGLAFGFDTLTGTGTEGVTRSCAITVEEPTISLYVRDDVAYAEHLLTKNYSTSASLVQDADIFTNYDIVWASSDENVMTVEPDYESGFQAWCMIHGHHGGTATLSAEIGSYRLEKEITVVDEYYEPVFLFKSPIPAYDQPAAWPFDKMTDQTFRDGDTIYLISTDISDDNYCYTSPRPTNERGGIEPNFYSSILGVPDFTYDTKGIARLNEYIHNGCSLYIHTFSPGVKTSMTCVTKAGKSCTIYFESKIQKVGLCRLNTQVEPTVSFDMQYIATTDNGGSITFSRAQMNNWRFKRCPIVVSSMEYQGYSLVNCGPNYNEDKAAFGTVESSNTSVVPVASEINDNNNRYICYYYLDMSKATNGKTTIKVKSPAGVVAASFDLTITD